MKIGHNLYRCGWCGEKIKNQRFSMSATNNPNTTMPGRHTTTGVLHCPKCSRAVSQRTKEGGR